MTSFMSNIGLFTISMSIIYGYKKIQDYYYEQPMEDENESLPNAAEDLTEHAAEDNRRLL